MPALSTIIVLAISLSSLIPSTADARPRTATQVAAPTSWIATLTDWLARLLPGTTAPTAAETPTGSGALRAHAAADTITLPGNIHTMTGTCIDPNGHPVPCNPL
jgi:hypothetical protein